MIPVLYVVFQRLREKLKGGTSTEPTAAAQPVHAAPEDAH
jgi:hypothetical protein